MKLLHFTDNFVSGIHGLQLYAKQPWSQVVHGVFPCLHFPLSAKLAIMFLSLVLWVGFALTAMTEQARRFFSSLYFFLNPCGLFLALIFFIGLLSLKSWTPASVLCSCLYCCIPSQGMGVEDAVFSVVGKWRPAILESFHRYTSSGFYSKLAKHPEGMTRWSDEVWFGNETAVCDVLHVSIRLSCSDDLDSGCTLPLSMLDCKFAFSWHGFLVVSFFLFLKTFCKLRRRRKWIPVVWNHNGTGFWRFLKITLNFFIWLQSI